MRLISSLVSLLLLSLPAAAQRPVRWARYSCICASGALSSATYACTVQQPATGSKPVRFISASLESSVASTATVSHNGTAASSTTTTPQHVNHIGPDTPAATCWAGSNVGTGTAISGPWTAQAAVVLSVNLAPLADEQVAVSMAGDGTTVNVTIKSSAITGTVVAQIVFEEQQ